MLRYSRHRTLTALLGVGFGVILFVGQAHAVLFHVAPSGTSEYPYSSRETATPQVAEALAATSGHGDTVYVHPGLYEFDVGVDVPVGVSVIGEHRDSVVFRWRTSLRSEVSNAWLMDLSWDHEIANITFGKPLVGRLAPGATAILAVHGHVDGQIIVHHCRFETMKLVIATAVYKDVFDNEFYVQSSGGMKIEGESYGWIHHNRIFGGVGVWSSGGTGLSVKGGEVLIEHNIFDYSQTGTRAQGIYMQGNTKYAVIRNNLLLGGRFPLVWEPVKGVIEQNTFVGPVNPYQGGVFIFQVDLQDKLTIRNNVFIDMQNSPRIQVTPTGPIEIRYNAYWPADMRHYSFNPNFDSTHADLVAESNMSVPPVFDYDTLAGIGWTSFRLQSGSPLIDAGDPSVLDADGSRSDIGWTGGPAGWTYEYTEAPPSAPTALEVSGEEGSVILRWQRSPEADIAEYRVYRGSAPGFWTPELRPHVVLSPQASEHVEALPAGMEQVSYVIVARDRASLDSEPSEVVSYTYTPANHAPKIAPVESQAIQVGETLDVTLSASDTEGDHILWSVTHLPSNADFDAHGDGTATLMFTPTAGQLGSHAITVVASDGVLDDTATVAIEVDEAASDPVPRTPVILRAYPNPFNSSVLIDVSVPSGGAGLVPARLEIYNVLGQHVATPFAGQLAAGKLSISWDGRGAGGHALPSGAYFARLTIDNAQPSLPQKLILLR